MPPFSYRSVNYTFFNQKNVYAAIACVDLRSLTLWKCVPETIPIFDFQTKISEMYQSLFENRHNMENFRLNSENANFRWRIATDARTTLWTSIYYNRHPNPIYINIHFRVERTKKGLFCVFFPRFSIAIFQ